MIAPGGGYHLLSIDKEGSDVATKFSQEYGMDVFVLKYRVPARPPNASLPKWWAPLQDAQRAMGIIRSGADEMGINASRIGFLGFSAGGHLTAHISTAWQKRIYAHVDKSDLASARPSFSVLLYPWYVVDNNAADATQLSPEISVDGESPPAFLSANQDDPTAPFQNSIQYHGHLASAGVKRNRVIINPLGGHAGLACAKHYPLYNTSAAIGLLKGMLLTTRSR